MSRVLLAGVAVAGVAATTSAFTAGNTLTADAQNDDVAGFVDYTVSGATVSNIAYNALSTDATQLDSVVFTVTDDASNLTAHVTVTTSGDGQLDSVSCSQALSQFTCDVPGGVAIADITKVGLTVTSK